MAAAQAAGYTVYEIIDRVPTIDSESDGGSAFVNGDINFNCVDFTFPARQEQQVLKEVSFKVTEGQTVALCGQSGCGKSTCIKLLQRFYDVCSGSITISGTNIKVSTARTRFKLSQLCNITYVPVFHNTVDSQCQKSFLSDLRGKNHS